ncbi:hypothetical protein GCM10020254_01390 [Streptomyces goshikiensis]
MTSEQWSAAVRLLWGPPAKPAGGPKRGLTLEGIALAGVGIADAEGLGGVSMQRVAAELAVTKMALYRYVPGKAELVALMVEAALPDPAGLDAGLAAAAASAGGGDGGSSSGCGRGGCTRGSGRTRGCWRRRSGRGSWGRGNSAGWNGRSRRWTDAG